MAGPYDPHAVETPAAGLPAVIELFTRACAAFEQVRRGAVAQTVRAEVRCAGHRRESDVHHPSDRPGVDPAAPEAEQQGQSTRR